MPAALAVSAILAAGPTRIGTISFFCAASTAPVSADASHGYATAVGTGSRLRHRSSSASYLPVPVFIQQPPVSSLDLALEPLIPYRPLCGRMKNEGEVVTERPVVKRRLLFPSRDRCVPSGSGLPSTFAEVRV